MLNQNSQNHKATSSKAERMTNKELAAIKGKNKEKGNDICTYKMVKEITGELISCIISHSLPSSQSQLNNRSISNSKVN